MDGSHASLERYCTDYSRNLATRWRAALLRAIACIAGRVRLLASWRKQGEGIHLSGKDEDLSEALCISFRCAALLRAILPRCQAWTRATAASSSARAAKAAAQHGRATAFGSPELPPLAGSAFMRAMASARTRAHTFFTT